MGWKKERLRKKNKREIRFKVVIDFKKRLGTGNVERKVFSEFSDNFPIRIPRSTSGCFALRKKTQAEHRSRANIHRSVFFCNAASFCFSHVVKNFTSKLSDNSEYSKFLKFSDNSLHHSKVLHFNEVKYKLC